ncbi:hypothetical protein [Halobaculum sp. MBLA0143]|uniref:hypothetical protein n=1 Tax=Halobaculum sp. MBLA0143 TaxID=3079933 RepID=UPI00352361AB
MSRDRTVVTLVVLLVTAAAGGGVVAARPGTTDGGVGLDSVVVASVDATDAPTNGTANETTDDTTTTDGGGNETAGSETNETNRENVTAGVGRQLATTLTAAGESVRGNVSRATFRERFRRANETVRAGLLADRAAVLTARVAAVDADAANLTAAYRAGNLSATEFAFQTALVTVRAESVAAELRRLRSLATNVSGLELAAAGYDGDRVRAALATAESASGPAATALRRQFTRGGDSRVAVAGAGRGLSVAGDGGASREFERPPDGNSSLTVDGATALATARGALSTAGSWTLRETAVDAADGTYEFEFRLAADDETGEASVTVDGSTGAVVALEEEIETERGPPDDVPGRGDGGDDEDGDEGDTGEDEGDENSDEEDEGDQGGSDEGDDEDTDDTDDDRSEAGAAAGLAVVLAGQPTAGETVRVTVLDRGPVANATVSVDGAAVATTDATGTATVPLPAAGETTIRAEANGSAGSLTVSLGERGRVADGIDATGRVDDGTVTVRVTYEGSPTAGVRASVGGDRVGVTGPAGEVSFDADPGSVTVRLEKGRFRATLSLAVGNDSVDVDGVAVDDEEDERGEDNDGEGDDEEDERDDGEEDDDGDDRGEGDGARDDDRDENDRGEGSDGANDDNGNDDGDDRGEGNDRGEGGDRGDNGDDGERGEDGNGDGSERENGNGDGSERENGNGDGSENGDGRGG